jgi:hypothetical protein
MRVPSNIIKENKYTIGKEYMYAISYKEYQGYYYEINGKFFAGKIFKTNSSELIRIETNKTNTLLTRAATYIFGKLSNTKINNISFPSVISKGDIYAKTRYFTKKINNNPILIREINKDTFSELQNNPIYQTISIDFPEGGYFANQKTLDDAEKQMPGIKTFILSELPPD